jgi:hypothetical protein
MTPPPHPKIITDNPQRKFYGLKNLCVVQYPARYYFQRNVSEKVIDPIDVANFNGKMH